MIMATGGGGPQACVMQSIPRSRPDHHTGRLIWGTLAGACLVAFGLGLAYLVIGTPLVARLLPGSHAGPSQVAFAPLVWALAMAAGAALLVAGTNRLALTVASVQRRYAGRSPVMRVMGALPDDLLISPSCRAARPADRSRSSSSGHSGSPSSRISRAATDFAKPAPLGRCGPATAGSRRSIRSIRVARDADRVAPLADPRRPRLRGARLRCVGHVRRDDHAHTVMRGHRLLLTSCTGSRHSPVSAAFQRGAAEPPADTDPRRWSHGTPTGWLVGEPGLEPGTSGI